jgi:hypothetical protein
MAEPGSIVSAELLGQPKPCSTPGCEGEAQAAHVRIATSRPNHDGVGWARHCPKCEKQWPLSRAELQKAKNAYAALQPAPAGGWTAAGH